MWLESWICTGWLNALVWTLGCKRYLSCTCLNSTLCPVTSLPTVILYSQSLGVMIMLSCSANHLYVCHHCISGITGLFVCSIISSISVPAHQTHSHLYSSSTSSYAVYCSLVPLSLSLMSVPRCLLAFSWINDARTCSFITRPSAVLTAYMIQFNISSQESEGGDGPGRKLQK